ncbi:MAG: hypothetical protein CML12_04370 [Puniceicoccaceae bacterium]|nr:hypothetical protein [Puniceicoccaceae bacterium]
MLATDTIISTNLNLYATEGDICSLCDAAISNQLESVLVYPTNVQLCAELLDNTNITIDSVIAYPHGRSTLQAKISEIDSVAKLGATAVTVFINYSALRAGEKNSIAEEIELLTQASKKKNLKCTIALEASILKTKQLKFAFKSAIQAQSDAFLCSIGSSLSETSNEISQLNSKKNASIKIVAYLKKVNAKDINKLKELGADRILSDGNLNKIK